MRVKIKYICAGIGTTLIVGCLMAVGFWWNSNRIQPGNDVTAEDCERIQLGMTERQVESILGRPADRKYHPWDIFVMLAPAPGTSPEWEKLWISKNNAAIIVHFGADGKVCNKALSTLTWE